MKVVAARKRRPNVLVGPAGIRDPQMSLVGLPHPVDTRGVAAGDYRRLVQRERHTEPGP